MPAALVVPNSLGDSLPLHMTPPPDSLVSPVDSSFLEGASSLARFGLDIGGTLCKVVFFEPIITAEIQAPAPSETPKSRFSRESFEDDNVVAPSVEPDDASNSNGSHENEIWSDGKKDFSMFKSSKPTPKGVNKGGERSKREHSRQLDRKMWNSSHDPVHIPGRGTLYFKCFGVSQISTCLLACAVFVFVVQNGFQSQFNTTIYRAARYMHVNNELIISTDSLV